MARYVQRGDAIDYTPVAAVAVGDVVALGTAAVGVATNAIPAGVLGALAVSGVFALPKATGASSAMALGSVAYWDGSEATNDADDGGSPATAYARAGIVVAAAGDNDAEVMVRLG